MDDIVLMEVLEGCDDLEGIVLDFDFCEAFPPFDEIFEGLVGAVFHDDVDVFGVLEDVGEGDDGGVGELFVEFYLEEEFVALFGVGEGFFGDYFAGGVGGGGGGEGEDEETFGETAGA